MWVLYYKLSVNWVGLVLPLNVLQLDLNTWRLSISNRTRLYQVRQTKKKLVWFSIPCAIKVKTTSILPKAPRYNGFLEDSTMT